MAILKLIVKQSQSQKKTKSNMYMLMYRYTHKEPSVYFYTGKNIDIQYFDTKNQCIKKSYSGYNKFNVLLSKQRQKIEDFINSALANDIDPTSTYIKALYNGDKQEKIKKVSITFWDFVDLYINDAKMKLKPNTLRSYNNIINNLKAYELNKDVTLNWESFDTDFYFSFFDFYTNVKELGNNGFGKIIKVLKSILNSATERGYNHSMAYKSREFKALREEVDNIYLSEEELKTIIDLDLSYCKKYEQARDLFIIGCYTGLRFSDFSTLTTNNISLNRITLKTQKTGARVVLPLFPEVKAILDKYNGTLPKVYCNQKMNQYLKIIAKEAKLNEMIEKTHTRGSKTIKKFYPKHDMVCTHTARRSFATNLYKRGIDTLAIMQLTGHSTEKSFMSYIKISKEENAQRILDQFLSKSA
ncbi:site-specific integrase [Flavobacterium sp. SM15]|uniref:site-specific integrase n=1 Tax=Flavobacterium sp. SM15 TaxID=2908005 RepID=UPI001EDBC44D|nr:site-specific integrase [Flavobacterium sp. SM15]MCG2609990.1 site-specific integrase [Flavobacterium sp. SM15]